MKRIAILTVVILTFAGSSNALAQAVYIDPDRDPEPAEIQPPDLKSAIQRDRELVDRISTALSTIHLRQEPQLVKADIAGVFALQPFHVALNASRLAPVSGRMSVEIYSRRMQLHLDRIPYEAEGAIAQDWRSGWDFEEAILEPETTPISTGDCVLLKDAGAVSGEWFQPCSSK